MSSFAKLLFSCPAFKGSKCYVAYYDDGSAQFINGEKVVKFTPEEILILIDYYNPYELVSTEYLPRFEQFGKIVEKNLSDNKKEINLKLDKNKLKDSLSHKYNHLYKLVKDGHKIASITGKKLLIAVGEKHFYEDQYDIDPFNSHITELMLTKICTDLGIKDLMIEQSKFIESTDSKLNETFRIIQYNLENAVRTLFSITYNDYEDKKELTSIVQQPTLKEKLIANVNKQQNLYYFYNYSSVLKVANKIYNHNNFKIYAVDPLILYHEIENDFGWKDFIESNVCGWNTRAKAINKTISKVNNSALLIMGAEHLKDISTDKELNSQFHIVKINTYKNELTPELFKKFKFIENLFFEKIDLETGEELSYICNDKLFNEDKYQEYVLDKKANISCVDRLQFLTFSEVEQSMLSEEFINIAIFEAIEMAINLMKVDPATTDESLNYLLSLEKENNLDIKQYREDLNELLVTKVKDLSDNDNAFHYDGMMHFNEFAMHLLGTDFPAAAA